MDVVQSLSLSLVIRLTVDLAGVAKPMMIRAQLGSLRASCPRGHMQAIPARLPSPSQLVHEAMTVKSTYPRGDKRRGNA